MKVFIGQVLVRRDPLVEYRRRGQGLFESMQMLLRREVLRNIMHAMPVGFTEQQQMHETELTRAARSSVDNADVITEAEVISEDDFKLKKNNKKSSTAKKKKAARKHERQNRKKARR